MLTSRQVKNWLTENGCLWRPEIGGYVLGDLPQDSEPNIVYVEEDRVIRNDPSFKTVTNYLCNLSIIGNNLCDGTKPIIFGRPPRRVVFVTLGISPISQFPSVELPGFSFIYLNNNTTQREMVESLLSNNDALMVSALEAGIELDEAEHAITDWLALDPNVGQVLLAKDDPNDKEPTEDVVFFFGFVSFVERSYR